MFLARRVVVCAHSSGANIHKCVSTATKSRPFPVLSATNWSLSEEEKKKALEKNDKAEQEHNAIVEACLQGGGEKGRARHVQLNKKILVRDRIEHILDEGETLFELGQTAGMGLEYGDVPCAGTVTGIGRIQGTSCMLIANDGSVKGGTSYPITVTKSLRAQEIAHRLRIPTVYVVDSGGAFLPLQSEIFPDAKHGGRTFRNQAVMSSEGIPQLALVSGLCTAGGAYTPTMSDEAIIVHRIGQIYLGGPPLVKAALGETVSGEELGGATLHCSVSGITDHYAENEEESFQILRDVAASLNIPEEPSEMLKHSEDPSVDNAKEILNTLGGKDNLAKDDIYALLASLLDGSRFSEFKRPFGGNLVTGFGFIQGRLVGLVANSGPISAADGQKGAHFIQLCDGRGIPIVFLQNSSKSFRMDGPASCDAITLKERAKFSHAQSTAKVPKITLCIGGCASDELWLLGGPSIQPEFYFMWPRTKMTKSDPFILAMEQKKAAEAKKLKELEAQKNAKDAAAGSSSKKPPRGPPPVAFQIAPFSAQFWASRSVADGVILPGETRKFEGRSGEKSSFGHAQLWANLDRERTRQKCFQNIEATGN